MKCEVRGVESGSLTSVEDPKRDELDLDDGGDDTHPTAGGETGVSTPLKGSWLMAGADTHIAKSRYCRSLMLWPSCRYERDRINEIAAWMKTLVYT